MKHFLIYTNPRKDKGMHVTKHVCQYLENHGQKCTIKSGNGEWTSSRNEIQADTSVPEDASCMIVLGGDGTMLKAARELRGIPIPMTGVNLGTLGYMTEIEPANLEDALDRLIAGDYETESRMMLNGRAVFKSGGSEESWALNDIVISREGPLRVVKFNIFVNGQFLNDYNADGIIITTPTGSTGYNLSAGGPIVEPGAKLIVVTPICAHTLSQRSIVLSPEDEIEIAIPLGREGQDQTAVASFDGSHVVTLRTGEKIRIVKSDKTTEFIQLNQVSFLEVMHKKMNAETDKGCRYEKEQTENDSRIDWIK